MTHTNSPPRETARRRTFAIISHPDAGKTTVTEKLLFLGGAIQIAGTVKARKSARHATSDWMAIEKERGISVTSSVMQFEYQGRIINLLDTPGHEDFSEDTYRTLTAVDSALMVIDSAKGVEARTEKLMDVCRLRTTPIMTFINKLDRDSRDPIELLDEIESTLGIACVPITWPVGSGKMFRGVIDLHRNWFWPYGEWAPEAWRQTGIAADDQALLDTIGGELQSVREEAELVIEAGESFDAEAYLAGKQTPVFFGSALNNFGLDHMLGRLAAEAPSPLPRATETREVTADEAQFSGFVFKIQANMDPAHRDRIAFLRICSGHYRDGMKVHQVRLGRDVSFANAVSFLADERVKSTDAWPGDILGIHNHGTIQIGDTFSEGEALKFVGVPHFAPELFRRVILKDPLKAKALQKGLIQLSEEGATQVFRPLHNNDLILGAVGLLQFDVVMWRLKSEYKVECAFENSPVNTVRWIECEDANELRRFTDRNETQLARDGGDHLAFLATSRANLNLTQERWPDIRFLATREL